MELSKVLLVFGNLFICVLQIAGGKHKGKEYCDYTKSVYYSEAVGGCKKCDPCFKGYGLADKIDFEIDSEKGALGCRVCRPCGDGFFQKRFKAFKKCKECKVCKIPGQYEIQKCTTIQNRKCKNIKNREEDTVPTISKSAQKPSITTENTPTQKFPVAAPIRQSPKAKASPSPENQENNNVVVLEKGFQEYKSAFIVAVVFASFSFTVILVFVVRSKCVQKTQQTALKLSEIVENEQGQENQENTESSPEASRGMEPNTEITDVTETEPKTTLPVTFNTEGHDVTESARKRFTENIKFAICKNNRSRERCTNHDSSFPLLPSNFTYNLPATPQVSNLRETSFIDSGVEDGIRMLSENTTSISDVSDSERCDTPTPGLGASDVTNDGSSCNPVGSEEDEKHLTEAELQTVAHRLAPDFFKRVGRELGVTDNEIRIIQANHSDVEDRAYEVLKKWTEKKASSATKKNLKQALFRVGREDVIETFYKSQKL